MTSISPALSSDIPALLAPHGRLRAAINLGNVVLAQRGAAGGEPAGASVALAREIARRLAVPLELRCYESAGAVAADAGQDAWDLAFLAVDAGRAASIGFSAPYLLIEGTYLVREASPLREMKDFDRAGVRIAVSRGSAYELYLSRHLRQAELVRADDTAAAFDVFRTGEVDALAAVRQPLAQYAAQHAGVRVAADAFQRIGHALAVPAGRAAVLPWLDAFLAEGKGSGFIAGALRDSGQGDATIAP